MKRSEWLKQMRSMTEALYDQISPGYWVRFGLYENATHLKFLQEFIRRIEPGGTVLSAACGAGRYDGFLINSGFEVTGIDQSAGMLARARDRFPQARYLKDGLQEMTFRDEFDGILCLDALEHISPEDWPGILRSFHSALKPGGYVYFTVEPACAGLVEEAYARGKARGIPVELGEVVDGVEESYLQIHLLGLEEMPAALEMGEVYHFYPSPEQVRDWLTQAGLEIVAVGDGSGYRHILTRKKDDYIE